ncbi:LPS assembly lipoprotein LptE [Maritalea porphyrae]|uniref:LPS assembly lipoprotein LptE n=1 Tax=Maritalea porphyrae TaxID=880732 RepID=UPI0022B06301|nr:LPS assembly lipoprotein LptE [Maritalea porphyrae]MCZ4272265.1 LPS assembly lipoprotein LptE [Maritalea porphyrae]
MSLFDRRASALILVLASTMLLAACTLRPVYEEYEGGEYALSYQNPTSPIEQTIIQDLAFKLGRSFTPDYALKLSTTTSTRSVFGVESEFTRAENEATVRTSFVLTNINTDKIIAKGERFSSAIYQSSAQEFANKTAQTDAYHRAAKDLARQLELLIVLAINEQKP